MICLIVKTPAALRTTLSLTQTSLSLSMKFCPQRKAGRRTSPPFFTQFHGPLLDYRRPPTPRVILKAPTCFFCILLASGWYIFIETSFPRRPNDAAKLVSANVPGSSAGGGKCLSFWYHMYGAHINALRVYVRSGSKDTLLWSKTGTRGDKWLQAALTVNIRTRFQVGFYWSIKKGFLRNCKCPD